MTSTTLFTRSRLRWLAPLVAALVLAGVVPAVTALTADARTPLPDRTAAQLLADVQQSRVDALSGTIVQTTDLGLPQLPGGAAGGGDSISFSSLVSGSHTMRLWYDGPQRVRLALLGQLGESDLIRNGSDAWAWSSSDNTATHFAVSTDHPDGSSLATSTTPQQAAEAALKAIDPTTKVSTERAVTVADRSAYQLLLQPRDQRSLIGSVRIAIDGATKIPTRVQVFARGATTPAFELGFTSFTPTAPPASTFDFTPPPGATVTEAKAPDHGAQSHGDLATPQVVGKGWTSVVVADLGSMAPTQGGQGEKGTDDMASRVLKSLPEVSGSWGSGHLLRGSLFSVLVTDDGRVVAGAVEPDMLYAALGRT